MASLAVRSSSDPAVALAAGESFLLTHPEHNSIILTVLHQRIARFEDGRYWWVCDGDEVVAFALQSPLSFRSVLAPAGREAVEALVDAMAEDAPDLPGILADAPTASTFAGRWAEVRITPVRPVEAQRLHRVVEVHHPMGVSGALRLAGAGDRPVLLDWTVAFLGDIESSPFDPEQLVDRHLATGRLWVWEVEGEPVSMVAVSATVGGIARIQLVYTPSEHRRHGYAAACVAEMSDRVLREGTGCILHTQLHNPTSNGVYRRIGYVPIEELVIYRFG
jgi:GNAT superfamily N-acetyltransferase